MSTGRHRALLQTRHDRSGGRRLDVPTRMALQMLIGVGSALVVGQLLFGAQWGFTSLSAFLQQTFDDRTDASRYGAGWHLCPGALSSLVDGHEGERPTGERARAYGWAELDVHYAELYGSDRVVG